MKRLLVLLAVSIAAIQLGLNCAQPLESTANPPITVIHDTIETTDTLEIIDTFLVLDTVFIVDTIIVVITDSSTFCGTIPSNQNGSRKTIAWFLNNDAGKFKLEFVAIIESEKPPQSLEVEINGTVLEWRPVDSMDFTVDMDLARNATVKVSSTSPHAYGHAIDICLKITPI